MDAEVGLQPHVVRLLEERRLDGVRVEPAVVAVGDEREPVRLGEREEAGRVELGGANDGQRLGHHQLVGAVSVEVHAGQEGGLRRVRLERDASGVRSGEGAGGTHVRFREQVASKERNGTSVFNAI